jgi:L-galactose dehydrogenase
MMDPKAEIIQPDDLDRQFEQSLRLLKTDYVDVYQLHGVSLARYEETVARLYPRLQQLRDQGKVRFLGITEGSDPRHAMLARAVPSGLWDTVMVKYGILNQIADDEVLPLCSEHNVGVLNMASVRVKLTRANELRELMADWAARGLIPAGELDAEDPLGWLVQGSTGSVISAGYKFAADHPAVSTVLTGTANISHLEENTSSILGEPLPAAHSQRLRQLFGKIAEGV